MTQVMWEEKIIGGTAIKVFPGRPKTIYQMFRDVVKKYPHNEAVKFGETSLTYVALSKRVQALASYLTKQCYLSKGDRVALFLKNDDDFATAFFAVSGTGAISVIHNTKLKTPELKYQLDLTTPRCAIVDETIWSSELDSLVKTRINKLQLRDIYELESEFSPADCDEEDVNSILFTSGTTGHPKGVNILHRNLIHSSLRKEKYSEILGIKLPDGKYPRTIVAAPLFHVMALGNQFLPSIRTGGAAILMDKFNTSSFLELIEQERIDRITGSPSMLRLLLMDKDFKKYNLSSIRLISFGSAAMPPDTIEALKKAFPGVTLTNGFGLTEASAGCINLGDGCIERPASVGKASLGCEVKIVDKSIKEVAKNTIGEIVVTGPHVAGGYYKDPENTEKSFKNGWFFTGDLGYIDEDGYVYISSRKTDMINRGGENVYPVEVENAICMHPQVMEVGVCAVTDNVMGEKVAAVIVPVPGAKIDADEIKEFCSDKLAKYKIPEYIFFSDSLPRNPNGKVVKKQLRNDVESKLFPGE